ncbi:integrin alpha-8-like [Limulus polyphemus]|uniref:Integrin alpha-8-like n=1 Tax=Limulus polyphemus TaxID=6850 RepID=A0ABM1BC69_LIMPO|nr:integrin alpha-8-like [Limulus polyphemus]
MKCTEVLAKFKIFFIFVTWQNIGQVVTFNIDLKTVNVYRGPSETYFGFSVAQHQTEGVSWLLVGAPKAQTDQPKVRRGGAVYKCSVDNPVSCQQIPFDKTGHGELNNQKSDNKSNQWFGASVTSSGKDGTIVACAPRYVHFSFNHKRREPVGTCWISHASFSDFYEYSPCRTMPWGYSRQGSCQAGFSAAVTQASQVFSRRLNVQELVDEWTSEGPAEDDNSYLGYSLAAGEFTGDSDADIVVGMPRSNLTGKVVIFSSELRNVQNITTEDIGTYFGYAVCISDINGDGLDDIIVGAPLHSNLSANDGTYEKGRVYVYYQATDHKFLQKDHLEGTDSKGRFGLALASLGDVDGDSYEDFAVGAPYAGKNERGIVFIYLGSHYGVRKEPSQTLSAEDINDVGLKTFGYSLAGSMDLDNNHYPDLLVGAYESDRAVFFRSRPVVNVTTQVMFDRETIDMKEKLCTLKDDTKVSCVVMTVCFEYNGTRLPDNIVFLYTTKLDANHQHGPRMFFLTDEGTSEKTVEVNLQIHSLYCKSVYTYTLDVVRDKLAPITADVYLDLKETNNERRLLQPVLNQTQKYPVTSQVNFQKNCGKDNVCIPDLKINIIPNMDQFLIGSKEKLELNVNITNDGEDAFEAMLFLTIPQGINYVNINKSKSNAPVSCSPVELENEDKQLVCDIGNPMPALTQVRFIIIFAPAKRLSKAFDLSFSAVVNSTNKEEEADLVDNTHYIHLPVRVEVEINLHGISIPETLSYNLSEVLPESKMRKESEIGPEVTHVYEVINRGPSVILSAEVHLLWPSYTLYGKHLLYLMEQPKVRGNGSCLTVPNINPLSLQRVAKTMSMEHLFKENENKKNTSNLRTKRTTNEEDDSFSKEVECKPNQCTHIRCTVYSLHENEQVFFTVRSRLWARNVEALGLPAVQISSKIVSRVTELPYDVDPSYLPYKVHIVTTPVTTEDLGEWLGVPWWVIVLAACLGLLVLGLLILVFRKHGFFERKRPPGQAEKEPLHSEKNGYQWKQGDEAL